MEGQTRQGSAARYHPGLRPAPPVRPNDDARVAALRDQDILDTPAERDFDDIAQLAAAICGTPLSAVTFVDAERQWLKARVGLDVEETSRDDAFCAHTIAAPDVVTVVSDALADERFATNPLVVADPNVRFYAGAPVVTAEGHALGAVCVLDSRPRTLTDVQAAALQALARQAAAQLERRRSLAAQAAVAGELVAAMAAPGDVPEGSVPPAPAAQAPPFIRAALGATAAVLVAAGVVLARPGTAFAKDVSDVMFVASSAAATAACARRATQSGSSGWRWLATACATWSAGAFAWAFFGLTRSHVYPFPSLADAGFVGYAAPALIGLWRLRVRCSRGGERAWTVLDGAVVAATTLFVSWATVLGPLLHAPRYSAIHHAVTLAYPIVDVVVLAAALAFGLRQRGTARRSWGLLAAGFSTLTITDGVYSLRQLNGTFELGHILDTGWITAFALIALAAVPPEVARRPRLERHMDVLQELVPYVPVGAAVMVAASTAIGARSTPLLFWSGMCALVLVAARQVTMVAERAFLTASLEDRVAVRTRELDAQRRFLGSVLDSLEEGVVACDVSGNVTLVNDAMRRMTGHDLAEIPADEWADHYQLRSRDGTTPLDPDAVPLARVLRGEVVRDAELTLHAPGRPPIVVSVNGRPVISASGTIAGAVVAAHDVTEKGARPTRPRIPSHPR